MSQVHENAAEVEAEVEETPRWPNGLDSGDEDEDNAELPPQPSDSFGQNGIMSDELMLLLLNMLDRNEWRENNKFDEILEECQELLLENAESLKEIDDIYMVNLSITTEGNLVAHFAKSELQRIAKLNRKNQKKTPKRRRNNKK
jgi:hypothetical protein